MRALALLLSLALATASAPRAQTPPRSTDRVGFIASIAPETVYVGQQATYALTVRIPTEIRQRLRRNPEFVPPEPRAMLAYDLPLTREPATGADVEVHVYRRALFALSPGRYDIPAARLSYALPQSPSFFSREEERTLRSDGVSFVAIDPPVRGRPAEWLGAVGRWSVTARVQAARARVGDPFVLVLRVAGEGNAMLLPRPPLEIAWADVVASDERIVLDSTPAALGGAKEFEWLVTPREDGARTVPPVRYVTFDPVAKEYRLGQSEPMRIAVGAGDRIVLPPRRAARVAAAPMALRPTLVGASLIRLPGGAWWLWIALLAPIPWAVARLADARRATQNDRAARAHRAFSRADFDLALRERTGIEPSAQTSPGALARALRLEGVTPAAAAEAEELRDAFDVAFFAASDAQSIDDGAKRDAFSARAVALLTKIDREARRRATSLMLALMALVALGGVAGCRAVGSTDEQAMVAFAEGRTAYAGQEYARAQDAFLRSARAAPRDVAAWTNFGAAAWQAGDSASAVLGWQRALRLRPSDKTVRDALAHVRAPQLRGAARVWPVSPLPLAGLALGLWFSAWAFAFVRRRVTAGRTARVILAASALVLASGAAWLDERLAARDLAVVALPSPLLALPALGADPGPVPLVGEIVRIVERRGVWVRLELSGDRRGWYPADRLYALARD